MHKLNNLLQSVAPQGDETPEPPAVKEERMKRKGTEKTELEILIDRKHHELKTKARRHWALLRESVVYLTKVVEQAEVKELVITHGIHRDRKINHQLSLTQVLYLPESKEYLTCDGHHFRLFHEDGRKKDVVEADEGINKLVFASQTNQFVGWVHAQENLYLMSRDFIVKSQSTAVGPIHLVSYNTNTGELITVGPHFITCWCFRYGARHLIPRKTTKTNFGERKMFRMMVLEETASRNQRMFFAQGKGVVVYNIYSGLDVAHKKELHAQPVTAITFFNPLKYVITGAKDGCIKVWDSQWKVKMVFVGHNDEISFIRIYPHGPAFISASLDCTIRVWNMETCDEVDKTVISEPVSGMNTTMNYDIFYTYAGKRVDLWRLQHLFHIHTNIGYRVNNIKVTSHPSHPPRAVCLCRDSSIRIVSPTNGEVITTLLLQPSDHLIDAAYAIAENIMFALLGNGDVIKCQTDHNPCNIVARWKCGEFKERCNYLLVYEYVVDPEAANDIWAMMKRTVQTKTVQVVGNQQNSNKNRTLLLGGRKDGYICVFDWHSGKVTFKVEAHGSKGVLNMIANSKSDQLISAGMDNIIKVWRLYPFAQEALAPLMSFYCAHTPSFMTTIKSSLAVAFQDPSTATFSVVVYSLPDKMKKGDKAGNRSDHKPDDDHMDLITGLTSCTRMKLYASCSMDGTIRIWSEANQLIRELKINTIPHSIAFCSNKGDLLVGLSNHLFLIPHQRYLPKTIRNHQVCMRFTAPSEEKSIPYDENKLSSMDKNDVKRLKSSHASFKFDHFVDILSPEEEEEVMREQKLKDEAFAVLETRENEIVQIRDGNLISKNKPKSSKKVKNRAFKEYMKMYYNKEREKLPADPDENALQKKLEGEEEEEEEEEKYRPDTAPYGFFSELSQKYLLEGDDPNAPTRPSFPVTPSGFLPNSVMLKILYPPPLPQKDPAEATPYHPPVLSAQQLAEIESLHTSHKRHRGSDAGEVAGVSRNVTFAANDLLSRVLEVDLSDDEEERVDDLESRETEEMQGPQVVFDDSMRQNVESAAAASSGVATIATPGASSAMTIRTFSDFPDSRFTTPKTPKTPIKSRLLRKKKTSFIEDSDDEDDDMFGPPALSEKSTSLMSKFQEIMEKEASDTETPTPTTAHKSTETKREPTTADKATSPRPLRPPKRVTLHPPPPASWVRPKAVDQMEDREPTPVTPQPTEPVKKPPVQTLSRPITKLISKPKPKARTPTPPRSPTPPPPPTPLPNFIKQFVGTEWFDKYFPNCNENTMPKPWTSDTFVNMIVKLLRIADWLHKVCVSDAIIFIHTEEGLSDGVIQGVVKTLIAVLNHHTNPPSCGVPEQKDFIMAGLRALSTFALKEKDVIAEMMVQFLDGDKDIRSSVLDVMSKLGLMDPQRQFQKELDSWDIWSIDEKNHSDELHKMSNQWLDRWMASYKMRIKDTVEKLNKGHSLHGRLGHRGSIMGGSRRGSHMPGDHDTLTTLPDTGRSGRISAMSHGSVTVTIDRLHGSSIMESVNYIDALNYFCEMMTEKELEALRKGEVLRRSQGETVVQAKNTVLVLPKIAHKPALVRLGEMHTSKCRAERETALYTDFRMPPITMRGRQPAPGDLNGFVPCINLPMKQVYLNPFPCAMDARDPRFQEPILITLKSSQKYFIPSQSYVPSEEPQVAVGS